MTKTECDGCGTEIGRLPIDWARGQKEHVIHGERADREGGPSPLPSSKFDWCMDCAKIAFGAVKEARQAATGARR